MIKNDILELNITGMTLQGDGIARCGGIPVFVPGVCPGDTVRALVLRVKPHCAFGRFLEVTEPSRDRVDPQCAAFPRCGGCAFRCLDYQAELDLKQREVGEILRRIGKIDAEIAPILGAPESERYRSKAIYPVRGGADGQVRAGFYARHSHRVVDCEDCRLQPALFTQLARAVCLWAQDARCSIYDETTGKGLLRHIYLRGTQNCAQALVCLVVNGKGVPQADVLVDRLRAVSPAVKGVLLNHNTRATNVALGNAETLLWGTDHVHEFLCGLNFSLSPLSFFQVNSAQAERLYSLAGEFAGLCGNERVLDLYCGTGTVGLTMAKKCAELVGVEAVPRAVEDARRNAERNGISNARFLCADASTAAKQLSQEGWRPGVILADPPRKGCEPALLRTMAQMQPKRVVYISCDPATLARDLAVLQTLGFVTRRVHPVDMFPRAGHVECVALVEHA